MLKPEENQILTQVGAGTPGGELLRRYWQPVCYASELNDQVTKPIKMLGEELVVYRDGDAYGLLDEHCAHRGTSLVYGFVEPGCALRCAYHGWKYDADGKILDQPFEPAGSKMKDRVKQKSYPVQELGGILFTYMGPQPAPLLPRWDVLVRTDGVPELASSPVLDCNWLQVQENSADTVHTFFLHAHMLKQQGLTHPGLAYYARPFVSYSFKTFEWGILKSFSTDDNGVIASETGNPLLFPNMLRVLEAPYREAMHWRVPVDDEHTRIFHAAFLVSRDGADHERPRFPTLHPAGEKRGADGRYLMDDFFPQDWMAWETQGVTFDRTTEKLGASDRGIAMFRRMLRQNIELVTKGEEPMALVRDAALNDCIVIPTMIEDPIEESDDVVLVERLQLK